MKKIITISLVVLSIIFCTATMADTSKKTVEKSPQPITHQTESNVKNKTTETTIHLYELPEFNSKIIKELPANSDLIAIFHKGNWIKVGDRQDGSTGWIDFLQYNKARHDFYRNYFHANTDTVYLHATKDKDGKMVITAYRDGKKLSDADAKKMYDEMQLHEHRQLEAMQNFNQMMDQQMQMNYLDERRALDNAFYSSVMFMPGVVVIEHPAVEKESVASEKNKDTTKTPEQKK